jgi:hypothetical protein
VYYTTTEFFTLSWNTHKHIILWECLKMETFVYKVWSFHNILMDKCLLLWVWNLEKLRKVLVSTDFFRKVKKHVRRLRCIKSNKGRWSWWDQIESQTTKCIITNIVWCYNEWN